jgi:hypothetical protein
MQGKLVILVTLVMGVSALAPAAENAKFYVCEGTFALCTTAQCTKGQPGDKDVQCTCTVNTGYSAGEQQCQAPIQTDQGTKIFSRFFPITSYQKCTNAPNASSPWAWCLDRACFIDKNNPAIAQCVCGRVETPFYEEKPSHPYVIVTGQTVPNLCQNNTNYSSATVDDLKQINDAFNNYLKIPLIKPVELQ